jgi:hypothetical protein
MTFQSWFFSSSQIYFYWIYPNESYSAGAGWMKLFSAGAAGWLIGAKFHSGRIKKKLNAKHKEDQKKLYQQYYNDVYSLQQQNAELIAALEQYAASSRRM